MLLSCFYYFFIVFFCVFSFDLQAEPSQKSVLHYDVAIVGGGVSGLYCALRLTQEKPDLKIILLEKKRKVGGRLSTDLVEINGYTLREEQGGMRFTFDKMDNLISLLFFTGLESSITPFPMNSKGNNRRYIMGESFKDSGNTKLHHGENMWVHISKNFGKKLSGVEPSLVMDNVLMTILLANPSFYDQYGHFGNWGPDEWQAFRLECLWKGEPVYKWTLWTLMGSMGYPNSYVRYLAVLNGLQKNVLERMNAGVSLQLINDFPKNPEFKSLKKGMESLPQAMKLLLEGQCRMLMQSKVKSLEKSGSIFVLNYDWYDADMKLKSDQISADEVILAIPRKALQDLSVESPFLKDSTVLKNYIDAVIDLPMAKINLYYNVAFWGNLLDGRVDFGANFTDLPLGTVYPFYSNDEALWASADYDRFATENNIDIPKDIQKKLSHIGDMKYRKPVALTIYCDYQNVKYWQGLQKLNKKYSSDLQSDKILTHVPVSLEVLRSANVELGKLFGVFGMPMPILTSLRLWNGERAIGEGRDNFMEEYGFGTHAWAQGKNDREIISAMVEPVDNIYVCGESFSDYQAWIEGALRSANLVLDQGFSIESVSEKFKKEYHMSPSQAVRVVYKASMTNRIKDWIDPDFST